jgi:ABC-2 type transport system ATP-binding protein
MGSEPAISAHNLTRRFGEKVAVDKLTLEVLSGEVFGFLGHNGAGKTTTIRLLKGILAPSEGQVSVLGMNPFTQGPALRRPTGVLTETPALEELLTARDNLRIYADLYNIPQAEIASRVENLLITFGLIDSADKKVQSYSKGMKQRVALARAMLHDPDILFLDEPTDGLDSVATRLVRELIVKSPGETYCVPLHPQSG